MSDTSTPTDTGPADSGGTTSDDIGALLDTLELSDDTDSSPASPDPAVPSAAAPTTPPAAPAPVAVSPPTEGPIPFDRHKEILEHTRQKARADAETDLRSKLGWAERYDPQTTEQGVRLFQWLQSNPQGFRDFLDGQLRQQQPAKDDVIQPLLKAEDGTTAYSADQVQKLIDRAVASVKKEVEEQYGPIRTQAQQRDLETQSQKQADNLVATMRSWPMFGEHEGDVKAVMLANKALSPWDAYLQVLREKALPSVETKIRSQYEGALKDKANASTVRTGPQATTPVDYGSMEPRDIAALTLDELEGPRR